MRILPIISALALVASCAPLSLENSESLRAVACDRPMVERFARQVLIDARLSAVQTVAFDCDGDGVPDDLGHWVPPSR